MHHDSLRSISVRLNSRYFFHNTMSDLFLLAAARELNLDRLSGERQAAKKATAFRRMSVRLSHRALFQLEIRWKNDANKHSNAKVAIVHGRLGCIVICDMYRGQPPARSRQNSNVDTTCSAENVTTKTHTNIGRRSERG